MPFPFRFFHQFPRSLSSLILSMPNLCDSDSDSPEKCRQRRRRRIELRRSRWQRTRLTIPTMSSNACSVISRKRYFAEEIEVEAESDQSLVENPMPAYGSLSIHGDDSIFVKSDFCRPEIGGLQPIHYFALYDGHTAMLCRDMMHLIIAEELMNGGGGSTDSRSSSTTGSGSCLSNHLDRNEEAEFQSDLVIPAMEKSFKKMDRMTMTMFAYEQTGNKWCCQPTDLILAKSTAVAAILAVNHIVIANSGYSRAVLCRDGRPIPLSVDEKEEWQPEILIRERESGDQCLILGTAGIWEVIPDEMACRVATGNLRDGTPANNGGGDVSFEPKSELAAAILCRMALARGSSGDNVSVIVIDLRRH